MKPPTHTHCRVLQPVVEAEEKTPDDVRSELRTRVKRSTFYREKVQEMLFTDLPKKDPNCEICKLRKTSKDPCKNRSEARGGRAHHPQKEVLCYHGRPYSSSTTYHLPRRSTDTLVLSHDASWNLCQVCLTSWEDLDNFESICECSFEKMIKSI